MTKPIYNFNEAIELLRNGVSSFNFTNEQGVTATVTRNAHGYVIKELEEDDFTDMKSDEPDSNPTLKDDSFYIITMDSLKTESPYLYNYMTTLPTFGKSFDVKN